MANTWYSYNGTGDTSDARSYTRINIKPGCLSGSQICAIYAPDGGITPHSPLPANILTYISQGLSAQVSQPQLPAGTKFFVYLKG